MKIFIFYFNLFVYANFTINKFVSTRLCTLSTTVSNRVIKFDGLRGNESYVVVNVILEDGIESGQIIQNYDYLPQIITPGIGFNTSDALELVNVPS